MTMGFAKQVTLAGMAALLMGGSALADGLNVTGEIYYLERIALPDNAIAEVQLVDVSLADAPAEVISRQVISRQVIDPAGQVPIGFALPFDAADIIANHRYAIEARIEVDGQLRYINDTHMGLDPLNAGDPLRIRVVAVSADDTTDATGDTALVGTSWVLTELNGEPSAEGVDTTLSFREDGAGGRGGCNSYGGSVSFDGEDGIALSEVFSTMMACPDPQMAQEQAYFRALEDVSSYALDGDTLSLLDAEGTVLAVFNSSAED